MAIESDPRQKQDIAKLLGFSRSKLNDLEKAESVPEEIVEAARKIGIKFSPNVATKGDTSQYLVPFKESMEMAERMCDNIREDYRARISDLMDHIKTLKETNQKYSQLLQKNKILN